MLSILPRTPMSHSETQALEGIHPEYREMIQDIRRTHAKAVQRINDAKEQGRIAVPEETNEIQKAWSDSRTDAVLYFDSPKEVLQELSRILENRVRSGHGNGTTHMAKPVNDPKRYNLASEVNIVSLDASAIGGSDQGAHAVLAPKPGVYIDEYLIEETGKRERELTIIMPGRPPGPGIPSAQGSQSGMEAPRYVFTNTRGDNPRLKMTVHGSGEHEDRWTKTCWGHEQIEQAMEMLPAEFSIRIDEPSGEALARSIETKLGVQVEHFLNAEALTSIENSLNTDRPPLAADSIRSLDNQFDSTQAGVKEKATRLPVNLEINIPLREFSQIALEKMNQIREKIRLPQFPKRDEPGAEKRIVFSVQTYIEEPKRRVLKEGHSADGIQQWDGSKTEADTVRGWTDEKAANTMLQSLAKRFKDHDPAEIPKELCLTEPEVIEHLGANVAQDEAGPPAWKVEDEEVRTMLVEASTIPGVPDTPDRLAAAREEAVAIAAVAYATYDTCIEPGTSLGVRHDALLDMVNQALAGVEKTKDPEEMSEMTEARKNGEKIPGAGMQTDLYGHLPQGKEANLRIRIEPGIRSEAIVAVQLHPWRNQEVRAAAAEVSKKMKRDTGIDR